MHDGGNFFVTWKLDLEIGFHEYLQLLKWQSTMAQSTEWQLSDKVVIVQLRLKAITDGSRPNRHNDIDIIVKSVRKFDAYDYEKFVSAGGREQGREGRSAGDAG